MNYHSMMKKVFRLRQKSRDKIIILLKYKIKEELNIKIGILGPAGTFSEKAARQWNNNAELIFCEDIFDAVEALLKNEVDFSIVPIENSLDGSINITHDLLLENNGLFIIGELNVQIKHYLLSREKKIRDVDIIVSHPQPLAQCRKYIKKNLRWAKIETASSTSQAATIADKSNKAKKMAVIGSEDLVGIYKFNILAENIQDVTENFTRFIVMGRQQSFPLINDKTSIIVSPNKNVPGALYLILGEFASRKIDLTRVESRPTKKVLGEYFFYIDFKGNSKDQLVKNAFAGIIDKKLGTIKILGSYPRAD